MDFVDLFAGLGGFHHALSRLGHECVFACESDPELRTLYGLNYPQVSRVYGDIRRCTDKVPPHDILCAGFPCQPFSKSGTQDGFRDTTRGTLFHEILTVLAKHQPKFVILENVGNFELHDAGRTWQVVRGSLAELGYQIRATEHVKSDGHGLVSPHHLGHPHTRERFFVAASLDPLPTDPFPHRDRTRTTTLSRIVQAASELTPDDQVEIALSEQQIACIDHWNQLLQSIPADKSLPSFPIWGDEIYARYPFANRTPFACTKAELLTILRLNGNHSTLSKSHLLSRLPSYARFEASTFPRWKRRYLSQNRRWFREVQPYFPDRWVRDLRTFVPSHRKLEWNCQGEDRDLWECVLQFRPSGLRAKRYVACPALVAMTTTQIPVLGPERRFLTRTEGLRLQGFPDSLRLPFTRPRAFRALGNAVHVDVAQAVARGLTKNDSPSGTNEVE